MNSRTVDRVLGAILFVAVIAAWVYCKVQGINTTELLAFAVPVIGALFLVGPINAAASSASQAATQTNGMMGPRIEAAVASALAKRDAARTRLAQGDISETAGAPTAPAVSESPEAQSPDAYASQLA
jgi:hypothetical protein